MVPNVIEYSDDHTAIGVNFAAATVLRLDPTSRPARPEQILADTRFTTITLDKRRLAYQTPEGRIMVTAYPALAEIAQVAREVEPLWLSNTELVYRSGVTWYSLRVDPATGEALSAPVLFGRDSRFSDTSGWSNRGDTKVLLFNHHRSRPC